MGLRRVSLCNRLHTIAHDSAKPAHSAAERMAELLVWVFVAALVAYVIGAARDVVRRPPEPRSWRETKR